MSDTRGNPERYNPPAGAEPPEVPEPPSISDAAAQWDRAQADGSQPAAYAAHYAPAHAYAPIPGQAYAPPRSPSHQQGLAITSLVLGIIAFFTGWIPVWGFVIGALAVVIGAVAVSKKQSKAMAVPGIMTGALAAATSIVVLVFVIMNSTVSPGSIDTSFEFSNGAAQTTLGPTPVDGGLAIAEQAFGAASYDDTVTWFVVILNNPSDNAYSYANVTVNALDASGKVIDSAATYPALPAGSSALTGNFYGLGGAEVSALEVVAPTVEGLSNEPGTTLTATDVSGSSDGTFTTVTGNVITPDADLPYGAAVTVIARDQSGQIIESANGYVDKVDQGQSATFEALFYYVLPNDTTYETYVTAY